MFRWLARRIHPVFLISFFSAGVLVGCLMAYFIPSGWLTSWMWWPVWVFWLGAAFWRHRRWGLAVVLIVGAMIGYARGVSELASWVDLSQYTGRQVSIRGIVREDPEKSSGSDMRIRLASVEAEGRRYGGVYWVTVAGHGSEKIERSDRVTVRGALLPGFGTFAGSMYRAQIAGLEKQVRFDPMLGVRNAFADAIRRVIPDPEAALGIGYILGQKRALPSDFEEALLAVGLMHVVVASGYNLTILVRISRRLFMRVSRYAAAAMSGGLVIAFIGVTGLSPSMSRAGLVAGLSLAAWYYGRTLHPFVLLLVTAAVSVLVQPSYLWGDVGWLLSFGSFAGVMFLSPLLQAYFFGDSPPGMFRQVLGETFSAQLLTLPIILVTFGIVSNVALLANLLVLPLVPLAMLLVFIAGLASSVAVPNVAAYIALPAEALLRYMVWVVTELADLPWASTEVQVAIPAAVGMYAVIGIVIFLLRRSTGFSFRKVNLVE